ncbi:response regulator [Taibaiella lutea]|uniref:histidine kinase n=1 Tax=Taibaiella lutea TaxID=2608001 RepID=A0A5M6CAF6_9BACT|nr:response regulator [Taibaiella lutea]KAA5532156.1 response regulator [Taibaiella lutea]
MISQSNNNLKTGFGLSISLLIISSIVSLFCIQSLLDSSQWVRHTNEVKNTLENVLSSMKDAETGQRGYLLTGNDEFLDPFKGSYETANINIQRVRSLTVDNAIQQKSAVNLKSLVTTQMYKLQSIIDKKKNGDSVSFNDLLVGRIYMDSVRRQVKIMNDEESKLLEVRIASQRRYATFTPVVIFIAALLAIIISIVFYRRAVKDLKARIKLQASLEAKDKETVDRINAIQNIASQISSGDYTIRLDDEQKDNLGDLSVSLNKMADSLSYSFNKLSDNEWLQRGVALLNDKMVGEKDLNVLTQQIVEFTAEYTGSHVGAFYLHEKGALVLHGGYALMDSTKTEIPLGEGIVGQVMSSGKEIIIQNIDPDYVTISYGIGNIRPKMVAAFPVYFETEKIGVLELASMNALTEREQIFLKSVVENIGNAIQAAINHKKLQELLEETQAQSEELQAQHSELENMNAELEAHTQKLQTSEEELRVQQEELQQSNFELEERNRIINDRNEEIVKKAAELEQSTRYKSEFMANMSHELRTPLNSILLLSRYLYENSEKNLSEDQMESAKVIFNSGNGLLELINELLDLSKIEAGKMELDYSQISVREIVSNTKSLFLPLAKEKGIELKFADETTQGLLMETDKMKLDQIIKNLISNAIKFTAKGSVTLKINEIEGKNNFMEFSVIDTGVGIPNDKLSLVFEAFTQADGSTKRKYGGTGLGLSISRQLARLLGGEITVTSEVGQGSAFVLIVPKVPVSLEDIKEEEFILQAKALKEAEEERLRKSKSRNVVEVIPEDVDDDRNDIHDGDKIILIVEDDTGFAKALMQFAKKASYKCIIAVRGDDAVRLAKKYTPNAILLDIQLPVMDGWEVMNELKSNAETRHIPVHIMSSMEAKRESRLQGAVDFINKPIAFEQMRQMFGKIEAALNKNPKRVLIVEENPKHAKALSYFLESYNVTASIEHTVNESVQTLQNKDVDCVILDMGLPDKTSYETLEVIKATPGLEDIPIIVFTGKNLSHLEESRIRQYADSIVVKTAHSYQRILDEVALFLHLIEQNKVKMKHSERFDHMNDILQGKTILVADDDVRNIFSLTKALEKHQVKVITATDGTEALDQLERNSHVDIVLMDMMMPQMDGYETTTKIRNNPKYKNIPVIAVTAKAMLGDREKCIAAGASDYISKPVDQDQLVSLLRVWLYDKQGNS